MKRLSVLFALVAGLVVLPQSQANGVRVAVVNRGFGFSQSSSFGLGGCGQQAFGYAPAVQFRTAVVPFGVSSVGYGGCGQQAFGFGRSVVVNRGGFGFNRGVHVGVGAGLGGHNAFGNGNRGRVIIRGR